MQIELRHIHKRFGPVHANNDIDVTFQGGRIIGVLGENGAGKSTLMKILAGYQPADSGDIIIDGRVADYRGPQAAIHYGIGMLQQDPLDVPAFTVLENFIFGSRMRHTEARARLREISQRFGFSLDPDMPVSQLSIAQRQQLEIVRLLALNVRALILDEPTTGISAEQKALLFDTLRSLARNDGMTVLLVSHKLEDVIALCDEVVVLRAGRLTGRGEMPLTTQELVRLMFGQSFAMQERPAAHLGDVILRLEGVHLRDKRLSIEHLNLAVRAGEVIGLAGLDGSGQGLAMRACVGLVKPVAGRVFVGNSDMTGKPYRAFLRRGVAFSAAGRLEEGLVAGLSLTEHVALANERDMLVNWDRARRQTASQLAAYNVRGRPDDLIEQLSGGNQQRLLMALMPEQPLVMVLEQPTRGLDVDSAAWIWRQLLARREGGTAIVFSSDDLDELVAYSDRILVFYAGQIFEIPDASATTIDQLGHLIGGEFEMATIGKRLT
ncbi:MAG: ATP-binding cassette domain-containing protein [Chloroflexota bacterium]|nr:MAG: sugar ABC transporter ATP-binding protein [Chloroflexota bacterium]